MSKIFIGVAWPYANGPIHVGHMAGCNLPPDIFRKFHIMRGNEVLMVSGSDMHGTPVTVGAEKEGIRPEELAQKYHTMNDKALKDFGIEFDEFHSTEDPVHIETVSHLFKTIHENGYLYEKEMELPYCGECDRTLPDRYVEGECPFCHYENARGDQCEECGKLMDPDMLISLRCTACGSEPKFVTRSHFFFKLSALEQELKEWMSDKDYWRPHVLNFSRMFIEGGLKDRPVTRDTTYGIKIPFDGHDDKRIYVWFEAFMGYYTMAVKWAMDKDGQVDEQKLESFWKNPECRHYYFLGKDNIPFHTIFWPAVLRSFDKDLNLPYDVPGNAYLRFGGQQFSKSRGVSVSIKDIVEKYEPDAMRYYMTTTMPENRDTDFTWEDFQTRNNNELVATYGNFVHRTLSFTQKNFGQIPDEPGQLSAPDEEALEEIKAVVHDVAEHLDKCEFKRGIKRAMELARFGNQYIDTKAPWAELKQDRDKCAITLHTSLRISKALAVIFAPYLPFSSQKLWEALGEEGQVLDKDNWNKAIEPPISGTELKKPEPLFKKLEEIEEDDEMDTDTTIEEKIASPADELKKLDLRIGRIAEVHDHPDADKLIVMIIDLGDEERQLVAGLKEHYSKEELAGKTITVVCNLKPAKLRGIESQCMLLAASDDEKVSILMPDGDAKPGDRISGAEGAKQISFPEFQNVTLKIRDGNKAAIMSADSELLLRTGNMNIVSDKDMKPGSKIK